MRYQTLIHLGCGSNPDIDTYLQLANQVWLVDANTEVIEQLKSTFDGTPELYLCDSLITVEEEQGVFYQYNLPWASGSKPVSAATERLYPGLRCLKKTQRPAEPIAHFIEKAAPALGRHLLIIDLAEQNEMLLQHLEESELLTRFLTVIVEPANLNFTDFKLPASLFRSNLVPESFGVGEKAQVFERHPVIERLLLSKVNLEDQLSESAKQHTSLNQELASTKQQLAERDNSYATLTQEFQEAKNKIEDALSQNHHNFVAKNEAEARVAELETELSLAKERLIVRNEKHEDNFYRAFEDKFRGSRDEIKKRVKVYLPFVLPIAERHPNIPALDLGCGRGEWLEVLQEAGLSAEGVDQDLSMLSGSHAELLSLHQGDALDFLLQQSESSRICISLIHVVEHLPFDIVRKIVVEAKRVLVPDGILIMETPNPENFMVGSCGFYMDPTHINPLPPALLAFVPEFYGFEQVKILRLQENSESKNKERFEIEDFLIGISPDYAVVARSKRPAAEIMNSDEAVVWETDYGVTLSSMLEHNSHQES